MSHIFCCSKCRRGWQLVGSHEEVSSIVGVVHSESSSFGCITPLCGGQLVQVSGAPVGFSIVELPVRAFYRAIHGFGTGEGEPASWKEFVELIKDGKVVAVDATPMGQPERVILHQLVFEDGTRMHFDSSSRGACCYYIERPGKSCVEVVENDLNASTEAAVPNTGPHREEARRGDADSGGSQEPKSVSSISPDTDPQPTGAAPVRTVPASSDIPESTSTHRGWSVE